jgi:hypothetical protein
VAEVERVVAVAVDTAEDSLGDQSFTSDIENDEERDAAVDSSEEQPVAEKAETSDSGWEAPGVAEDARRPDAESIHIDEGRRGHILDGESGSRGGTGTGPAGQARPSSPQTGTTTRRPITSSMSDASPTL